MEMNLKDKFYKKWWFWVIAVVIVGIIGVNVVNKSKTKVVGVNYENFVSVKMGMKYSGVVKILGEGREEGSSEISGIKTVMYAWNGTGTSNVTVTTQNGVVTGKAQAGLKDTDAKVTLEKYNNVKEGMTYKKVKAVLGEGEITSETKTNGIESILYSWRNKDGSNMNCTFSNGKMSLKSQFNLK